MLKPGTIIGGKYRLRHLIAEGGMAEVYLVERCLSKNPEKDLFAIKRLLPALAKNPIFVDMFINEALLSSSLHHKNIALCHEFFRDGKDLFMVMELVRGEEISSLSLAIGMLSLFDRTALAIGIGLKVCDALSYVHKKTDHLGNDLNIVHGDLSPQNIMISVDGDVKLYDFGAAKSIVPFLMGEEDIVRGNLRYMSYEQIVGRSVDNRSDIYSLGIVLLEIVAGKAFLEKRNDDLIKYSLLYDPLSKVGREYFINEQIYNFFTKCLKQEPEHRFLTCDDMHVSLTSLAKLLKLKDLEGSLRVFMAKADLTATRSRLRQGHLSENARSFLCLSILIASLSLFIWSILTIGMEVFEPMHMRNVPYWPQETCYDPRTSPKLKEQ